jgi:heme/copper-type cytochrome/quinol oxidase subunit 4
MNIFVIAAVVSIVFLIMKFIEMRFIEKENKPLKFLIRDALLVYISVVSGYFIFDQLNSSVEKISGGAPLVFVDNPEF